MNRNYNAIRLVGDARLALEDLRDELGHLDLSRRAGQVAGLAATIAQALAGYAADTQPLLTSEQSPLHPERVMAELDSLLTEDTIDVMTDPAAYLPITAWEGHGDVLGEREH